MKNTRNTLGAVVVALASFGMLAACAPAGGGGGGPVYGSITSTKTINMTCNLLIYQNNVLLFPSTKTYNGSVLTLTANNSVPTGTADAYTATVTGIVNGPLPQTGGTANVKVDGVTSAPAALGAAAANAPVVIPTLSGSSATISTVRTINLTEVTFHALGAAVGDYADGTCTIPLADQPSISVTPL